MSYGLACAFRWGVDNPHQRIGRDISGGRSNENHNRLDIAQHRCHKFEWFYRTGDWFPELIRKFFESRKCSILVDIHRRRIGICVVAWIAQLSIEC